MIRPAPKGRFSGPAFALLLLALAGCGSVAGPASLSRAATPDGLNLDAVAIVRFQGHEEFCSGALVSPRVVLTALHCVQGPGEAAPRPASSLEVGFGDGVRDPGTEWLEVSEVRLPAPIKWSGPEQLLGNDLARLILRTPVDRRPLPARLGTVPPPGSQAHLIGFGEDRYGVIGQRHISRIWITDPSAGTSAGPASADTFTFVGAGCRGDSGGPILDAEGRLIGLVSVGTSRHCEPHRERFGQPVERPVRHRR